MLAALIFQPHLLPAGSKLSFCPHNNVTTSYTIVGKENVTDAIRRAASSSQCVQGGNAAPRRRSSGRASLLRLAKEQGPNGGRGGSLEQEFSSETSLYNMRQCDILATAATASTTLIRKTLKPRC